LQYLGKDANTYTVSRSPIIRATNVSADETNISFTIYSDYVSGTAYVYQPDGNRKGYSVIS